MKDGTQQEEICRTQRKTNIPHLLPTENSYDVRLAKKNVKVGHESLI